MQWCGCHQCRADGSGGTENSVVTNPGLQSWQTINECGSTQENDSSKSALERTSGMASVIRGSGEGSISMAETVSFVAVTDIRYRNEAVQRLITPALQAIGSRFHGAR